MLDAVSLVSTQKHGMTQCLYGWTLISKNPQVVYSLLKVQYFIKKVHCPESLRCQHDLITSVNTLDHLGNTRSLKDNIQLHKDNILHHKASIQDHRGSTEDSLASIQVLYVNWDSNRQSEVP